MICIPLLAIAAYLFIIALTDCSVRRLCNLFTKKYPVEFITGYKVTSNNAKYSFVVPFKLSNWQKGYTQIRIDWVARSSRKVKGEFMPYQNPSDPSDKDIVEAAKQYAEVDIGERELFDLE